MHKLPAPKTLYVAQPQYKEQIKEKLEEYLKVAGEAKKVLSVEELREKFFSDPTLDIQVGGSGKDPKKRVTNRLIAGFKEEWSKLEPDDRDKSPWSYLRIKQSKTPSSKEAQTRVHK